MSEPKPYPVRFDFGEYKNDTVRNILADFCPKLAEIMEWLESHLQKNEHIEFFTWQYPLMYAAVVRGYGSGYAPENIRLCLSVDLRQDRVVWNTHRAGLMYKGNCTCRSSRWQALVRARFFDNGPTDKHLTRIRP